MDDKKIYFTEPINPNLDNVSSINISSNPMGENRQDKGVEVSDSMGTTKRTSNIMMGYNKDNIVLPNGSYVSMTELENALDQELQKTSENTIIIAKSTGKMVDAATLKAQIREVLDKKAQLSLNGKTDKITNQETEKVSIKGENSEKFVDKGVFMFGNDGMKMPEDKYVNREEFEKTVSEYEFVTQTKMPEASEPEIEVVKVEPADKIKKNYKKGLLIAGGITAIGLSMATIIVPGIMHANSVLWNHTSNPVFQDFLHNVCNANLGKLIGATYNDTTGLWTATNGSLINATAAQASVIVALATHAINTSAVGLAAKKLHDKIKAKKEAKRNKKLEELNKLKEELTTTKTDSLSVEGGLSR